MKEVSKRAKKNNIAAKLESSTRDILERRCNGCGCVFLLGEKRISLGQDENGDFIYSHIDCKS